MSFRYHTDFCQYLPCECIDGVLRVYCNTGKVDEFETTIKENIHKQCCMFKAMDNIMWVLDSDDGSGYYIGRRDGTITKYAYETNLLIGIKKWKAPIESVRIEAGAYNKGTLHKVTIDTKDYRTFNIFGTFDEYVLHEPLYDSFNVSAAIALACDSCTGLHLVTSGGELDIGTQGTWHLQAYPKGRDFRRLL